MSLVEIARYTDVYEAELAAAFLESHGIRVHVTERHQTTIDPLMQRALGLRLLASASDVEAAGSLLARAQAGEFAAPDEEDDATAPTSSATRTVGTLMALGAYATGGFWGNSLPRRFRAPAWGHAAFGRSAGDPRGRTVHDPGSDPRPALVACV